MPDALIDRLCKPWFVYRPSQLIRRVRAGLRPPPPGYVALPTSWGALIVADPSRAIGRSILTTGVYDLAVSEVLARLIAPGDTVVDAGANVGYMTVLASLAAGEEGRVMAFEPHLGLSRSHAATSTGRAVTIAPRLRHVVFEDHDVRDSEAVRIFRGHG